MHKAVDSGLLDPQVVIIDARRHTTSSEQSQAVIPIGLVALRPSNSSPDRLRRAAHRKRGLTMSTRSDQAAQAAIGAAARELRLPTIRAQASRLPEIAVRERQSYLVFLAELLAPKSTTAPSGAAPAASPKPNSHG